MKSINSSLVVALIGGFVAVSANATTVIVAESFDGVGSEGLSGTAADSFSADKGTMTDRGTRVPLMVRWPGRIAAGSNSSHFVDFSDFMPTILELAGAPLPSEEIHGQSFVPHLLGQSGNPRDWVHVQDQDERHIRNRNFILNNNGQLRPVVEIWEDRASNITVPYTAEEEEAYDALDAVFNTLGN